VARVIQFYLGLPQERLEEYKSMHKLGYKALKVMEQQLIRTPFLVGDQFSIADIALYAYTHVAHQGGFDLAQFPAIEQWLLRVKEQPGYVGMLD
jgi:glutathione S-transferase